MRKTILIVSNANDLHALAVRRELLKTNCNAYLLECDKLAKHSLNFQLDQEPYLKINDQYVEISEISTVWWRRPSLNQHFQSENDYLGALKGNQRGLLADVNENCKAEQTVPSLDKGHGRIEKRTVSICRDLSHIRAWPGLKTLIRVDSKRSTIYYASLTAPYELTEKFELGLNWVC